jgi:hypothetical protein
VGSSAATRVATVNRMVDCVLSLDLEPNRLADFCKGREGDRLDWWVSVGMFQVMHARKGMCAAASGQRRPQGQRFVSE